MARLIACEPQSRQRSKPSIARARRLGDQVVRHELGGVPYCLRKRPPSEMPPSRRRDRRRADDPGEQPVRQAGVRRSARAASRRRATRPRARQGPSCSRRRLMSGERRERMRHASMPPSGSKNSPRTKSVRDMPFSPELRSRSSSKPSSGTTRASIPRAVPAKVIRASGSRRSSSRATAIAGPAAGDHGADRLHASCAVIAVVTMCVDAACCDTFNRIPIPIRLMRSDEPP